MNSMVFALTWAQKNIHSPRAAIKPIALGILFTICIILGSRGVSAWPPRVFLIVFFIRVGAV
jgi:hypothetical protein